MSNQNPAAKFITTHRRKSAANNKPDENQIPPTKIRPLLRLSEPPENASQEQFEIYLRNLENWFERIRNHAQPGGNDRDIVSILHLLNPDISIRDPATGITYSAKFERVTALTVFRNQDRSPRYIEVRYSTSFGKNQPPAYLLLNEDNEPRKEKGYAKIYMAEKTVPFLDATTNKWVYGTPVTELTNHFTELADYSLLLPYRYESLLSEIDFVHSYQAKEQEIRNDPQYPPNSNELNEAIRAHQYHTPKIIAFFCEGVKSTDALQAILESEEFNSQLEYVGSEEYAADYHSNYSPAKHFLAPGQYIATAIGYYGGGGIRGAAGINFGVCPKSKFQSYCVPNVSNALIDYSDIICVIVPDNDKPGEREARDVEKALRTYMLNPAAAKHSPIFQVTIPASAPLAWDPAEPLPYPLTLTIYIQKHLLHPEPFDLPWNMTKKKGQPDTPEYTDIDNQLRCWKNSTAEAYHDTARNERIIRHKNYGYLTNTKDSLTPAIIDNIKYMGLIPTSSNTKHADWENSFNYLPIEKKDSIHEDAIKMAEEGLLLLKPHLIQNPEKLLMDANAPFDYLPPTHPLHPAQFFIRGLSLDNSEKNQLIGQIFWTLNVVKWIKIAGDYNPTIAVPQLFVLVSGPPGEGKSSIFKVALDIPPGTNPQSGDRRGLNNKLEIEDLNGTSHGNLILSEKLRGTRIAEFAEIKLGRQITTEEVERLKNFIDHRFVTYRPLYSNFNADKYNIPIRSMLVGTTNDENPMTDRLGQRRFILIDCYKDAQWGPNKYSSLKAYREDLRHQVSDPSHPHHPDHPEHTPLTQYEIDVLNEINPNLDALRQDAKAMFAYAYYFMKDKWETHTPCVFPEFEKYKKIAFDELRSTTPWEEDVEHALAEGRASNAKTMPLTSPKILHIPNQWKNFLKDQNHNKVMSHQLRSIFERMGLVQCKIKMPKRNQSHYWIGHPQAISNRMAGKVLSIGELSEYPEYYLVYHLKYAGKSGYWTLDSSYPDGSTSEFDVGDPTNDYMQIPDNKEGK